MNRRTKSLFVLELIRRDETTSKNLGRLFGRCRVTDGRLPTLTAEDYLAYLRMKRDRNREARNRTGEIRNWECGEEDSRKIGNSDIGTFRIGKMPRMRMDTYIMGSS